MQVGAVKAEDAVHWVAMKALPALAPLPAPTLAPPPAADDDEAAEEEAEEEEVAEAEEEEVAEAEAEEEEAEAASPSAASDGEGGASVPPPPGGMPLDPVFESTERSNFSTTYEPASDPDNNGTLGEGSGGLGTVKVLHGPCSSNPDPNPNPNPTPPHPLTWGPAPLRLHGVHPLMGIRHVRCTYTGGLLRRVEARGV